MIRGYRWGKGPIRSIHLYKDQIVYDQIFQPNNIGYMSNLDFYKKKPTPETKRIIVLGDSMTGSLNFPGTWPDYLHELLQDRTPKGMPPVEVYNFALPGTGLNNWHNVFFNEIIPDFEFDGVILAVHSSDLNRDFYINYESEDGRVSNMRFQVAPRSFKEFQSDFLPRMRPYAVIDDSENIDKTLKELPSKKSKEFIWPEFKIRVPKWFYFKLQKLQQKISIQLNIMGNKPFSLQKLNRRFSENNLKNKFRRLFISILSPEKKGRLKVAEANTLFRPNKLDRMWEILNYCRENSIDVIISSPPEIEMLLHQTRSLEKVKNNDQLELEAISKYSGFPYVDGYQMYYSVPEEELKTKHWIPLDRHWQKPGADLFAEKIAEYINNTNWMMN